MITPLDIQNKEFKKSLRGYRESEVDGFLDEVMEDYEKLYKENMELKDKILLLNEQIEKYNALENTLKETLIVAQNTADEVILSAKKKSEMIIEEAKDKANKLIDDANSKVKEIMEEYESLLKEMIIFRTRYKSLIESQLSTLDQFYSEVGNKKIRKDHSENYITEDENVDLEANSEDFEEEINDLGA